MPCPLPLCKGYNIDVAFLFFKGTESDGAEDVDTVEMRAQWFKGVEIGINEWLNGCGQARLFTLWFAATRTESPSRTIIHVPTRAQQYLSLFQVITIVQFARNSGSPYQLYERIYSYLQDRTPETD